MTMNYDFTMRVEVPLKTFYSGAKLIEFLAELMWVKDNIPAGSLDDASLVLETEDDYEGGVVVTALVKYTRPMTVEEREEWVNKESNEMQRVKAHELAQLARLKAKYESNGGPV